MKNNHSHHVYTRKKTVGIPYESEVFLYRIRFAVYTNEHESDTK
jgi:hypothetical protein